MEAKEKLNLSLENLTVFIVGFAILFFPLLFTTINTDAFSIPKQALLGIAALAALVIFAFKIANKGSITIRRTPFDLPLVLMTVAFLLSAIFSLNRWDGLLAFFPFFFSVLVFFAITNSARENRHFMFLLSGLVLGGAILSLLSLTSYFKIYLLPFSFAKIQTFSLFGSLLDQALFLAFLAVICGFLLWPFLKNKKVPKKESFFLLGLILNGLGLLVTLIMLLTIAKPSILPLETGFQTAFAAISQDTGRILQGFLFGSGFGTFSTDFTRFKPLTINLNDAIWNLNYLRSSTFVLELLATTGILGFLSFIFLSYRILRIKPLLIPAIFAIVLSFLLPLSFTTLTTLLIILAILSIHSRTTDNNKASFYDEEIQIVSLKKGLLALSPTSGQSKMTPSFLSYSILAIILLFVVFIGFFSFKFLMSDFKFQKSLIAASQNDGAKTYDLQRNAISDFPYRDGYSRIFSQVNLTLANNFASSLPEGASPSAQQQQTIYSLIQQSINSGRQATTISPLTAANWNNLSGVYRSLIGFGQNADSFAIISAKQGALLDPNNPQQYINLGGIYYQLGAWDNAINQFQVAVNLKPNFANAYYNLGHALESKGDLENALTQYQTVKNLVSKDKAQLAKINAEIKTLSEKIGKEGIGKQTTGEATNQPELNVNAPAATLPPQNPPLKIPAPTTTPSPTASPSPKAE